MCVSLSNSLPVQIRILCGATYIDCVITICHVYGSNVVRIRDDSSVVALITMVDAMETSLRCVVAPSHCVAACLCSVCLDI